VYQYISLHGGDIDEDAIAGKTPECRRREMGERQEMIVKR